MVPTCLNIKWSIRFLKKKFHKIAKERERERQRVGENIFVIKKTHSNPHTLTTWLVHRLKVLTQQTIW